MILKINKIGVLCLPLLFSACSSSMKMAKNEGVSIDIPSGATAEEVIRLATQVRPSYRHIDYQQREMLGFIHVGMDTFTGNEWGTGKEDPSIFNPSKLDPDSWVKTFKDAGITGVILVAKHHDGFCVWPSKYTDHTVAHSPWRNGKGDLVKEVADACRKYDMKLCLYLSPWDMHEPTYGTEAYNDYYTHQMEELLTNYGSVYLFWFDGAGTVNQAGEKVAPLDWERYFNRARELQPDILLSGIKDIRWLGNEAGRGKETEWCVQGINGTHGEFANQGNPNLGTIEDLMSKQRLVWYPSRGGLPLRKGWFYKPQDDYTTKPLQYLVKSYFATVGQNANLLPNLSPDTLGLIPERDAMRLIEFGNVIKEMKKIDYAKGAKVIPIQGWQGKPDGKLLVDDDPFTSWHSADGIKTAEIEVILKQSATVNVIKLQENIRDYGQRVSEFAVDAWLDNSWKEVGKSTTIGFRKMLRLDQPVTTDRFRIRFLDARVSISLGNFSLYYLADLPEESNDIPQNNSLFEYYRGVSLSGLSGDRPETIIDHNPQTVWSGQLKDDHGEIIIKLSDTQLIGAMSYLPVNAEDEGHIEFYSLYMSENGKDWGKPVAQGRFGNIMSNPVEQLITFQKRKATYVKLIVEKVTSVDKQFKIAELTLYK